MNIKNVAIPSGIFLAPMAGVTDTAFRTICREMGAGFTCSEMVSAKALCYNDEKSKRLLEKGCGETPYAVQIFGSDEKCMGEAAAMAAEISGADIIDINMGCPVGKIVKSGDGSALMRDPDKAGRIIEAVCSSADIPVTVKFRKGWDKGSANAVEFGLAAQSAGAAAVAVHGRTRAQMYSGVADWDIIREVKSALSIPVIANGDVFSGGDARRILKYTGADGVMIGRGSFGNPWIFSEVSAALKGEDMPPPPTVDQRVSAAMRQIELAEKYKGEKIACLEARRHFAWYLKGVPHSSFFKGQISGIQTLFDAHRIADDIRDYYKHTLL